MQHVIDPNDLPGLPELMIAGPGHLHDADLVALGHQVLAHYGEVWTQLHNETLDALGHLLGTSERPYLIPGSGTACLEVGALNLFEPGDSVVVVDTGFFGVRLKEIAESIGLAVTTVPVEAGAPADPVQVSRAMEGAAGLITTHVDTSTGVRHPIDELARAAHDAGAVIMVDAIASAGGETIDLDQMDIDLLVSSTQKGLEAPPGLGIVATTRKGREKVLSRRSEVKSWYLSLARWDQYREEWGSWHPHPVTMPTNLVLALASSLKRILETGREASIAKRTELARYTRERLGELGLKPVPQPGAEANLVVAVWADDPLSLQTRLLEGGIMVSGGLGPTHDRAIRVGLMGRTATRDHVDKLVRILSEGLA